MVNVVNDAVTVTDIDQALQHIHDVVFVEDTRTGDFIAVEATIKFHASNRRQIVSVFGEEQVVKQRLCCFFGRRLTRAHHAINLDLCFQLITGLIDSDGVRNIRPAIEIIGVDELDFLRSNLEQLGQILFGDLRVCTHFFMRFTGFLIDQIVRQYLAEQVLFRHFKFGQAGLFHHAHMLGVDATARFNDDVFAAFQIETESFATQSTRHQIKAHFGLGHGDTVGLEKRGKDFFCAVPERAQND